MKAFKDKKCKICKWRQTHGSGDFCEPHKQWVLREASKRID